jgi:hypothetical protein
MARTAFITKLCQLRRSGKRQENVAGFGGRSSSGQITTNSQSKGSIANEILIDCTLRIETTVACRPEARHLYANYPEQVIAQPNIPKSQKQAFTARRFAPDCTSTYSITERLIDLAGPISGRVQLIVPLQAAVSISLRQRFEDGIWRVLVKLNADPSPQFIGEIV